MPKSVLEAVREGVWDYEPVEVDGEHFAATNAMPGTREKVQVLAARLDGGLPLWHPDDRNEYDPTGR